MWEGFYFLAKRQVWAAIPKDGRDIIHRNMNEGGERERADSPRSPRRLTDASRPRHGVQHVDTQAFRETLKKAGFDAEWQEKYGGAWGCWRKYVGGADVRGLARRSCVLRDGRTSRHLIRMRKT